MRIAFLTADGREVLRRYDWPKPDFGQAPEALLQGFAEIPDQAEVHVISCLQKAASFPEKLAPNVYYHGLVVPKIGWMRTGYQGCIRAVRKKIREINPDIVHGQGTERDCAMSAVFSGYPNVLTIHGNMRAMLRFNPSFPGSFHWLAAKLETVALKRTAGVFCNSAYTEELVGTCPKRVWRVPNAIRGSFFEPLTCSEREAVPVLLNIGVVCLRKRQMELLLMARNLHRRGFRFEINFAGLLDARTSYGQDFQREIAAAQEAGYARYLGTMGTRDLIKTMDKASALVHCPSEEAFGLVVAEGLARNLKFFGFGVGGPKEIALGVEGAELFSDNDWAGLENGIARWLEAGCPRPKTASQTMHSRYGPEFIARRHVQIYREVLNG